MDSESKTVKEMWWEDKDLHIITVDDKHTVYVGAEIVSRSDSLDYGKLDGTIKVERIRLYPENFDPNNMKGAGDEFGGTDYPEVTL